MTIAALWPIVANLVAISILTFGLYFPRHHRRDLLTAYLGVNVGVLAVASVLMDSAIGAGLGLGLFGVLSIIRLRSDELNQREVAYYFSALALGLLGGMSTAPIAMTVALMSAIVLVMAVADHPGLFPAHRRQVIVVDRALADEDELIAHLEGMLGGRVLGVTVQRVDFVNETTWAEVRWTGAGRRALHDDNIPSLERVAA